MTVSLPAWSPSILYYHSTQTTVTLIHWSESHNATQSQKMLMQDVGYELVYEPGKDEADPLD